LKNQGEDNEERAIKHIESEISAAATAAYIAKESGFECDPKAVAAFRRKTQIFLQLGREQRETMAPLMRKRSILLV
jgi:hypothetical protein